MIILFVVVPSFVASTWRVSLGGRNARLNDDAPLAWTDGAEVRVHRDAHYPSSLTLPVRPAP